jgi:hypothetical protein
LAQWQAVLGLLTEHLAQTGGQLLVPLGDSQRQRQQVQEKPKNAE